MATKVAKIGLTRRTSVFLIRKQVGVVVKTCQHFAVYVLPRKSVTQEGTKQNDCAVWSYPCFPVHVDSLGCVETKSRSFHRKDVDLFVDLSPFAECSEHDSTWCSFVKFISPSAGCAGHPVFDVLLRVLVANAGSCASCECEFPRGTRELSLCLSVAPAFSRYETFRKSVPFSDGMWLQLAFRSHFLHLTQCVSSFFHIRMRCRF
jgi:hypothetical protein